MSALGTKLRSVEGGGIMFRCPGCNSSHRISVGEGPAPRWGFNGNAQRPTFTPSILVRGTVPITGDEHARLMAGETIESRPLVCHSYITDGRIQFLSDCTHALAGQTVDLPEWPV